MESPKTHLQNFPMPLLSRFLTSNFVRKFFRHFSELHQKSKHFWTFLTLTSYSNHLNLNQMSLNLNFEKCPLHFFLEHAHFCESGKFIPVPKLFLYLFFLFFPFLPFFLLFFLIEQIEGERAQPRSQGGPSFSPKARL